MGREIESRQGVGRVLALYGKNLRIEPRCPTVAIAQWSSQLTRVGRRKKVSGSNPSGAWTLIFLLNVNKVAHLSLMPPPKE
jgi:hypothetical protein